MSESACATAHGVLPLTASLGPAIIRGGRNDEFAATSVAVISALNRHRLSLAEETDEWKEIEEEIAQNPPVIKTQEAAREALRTALRIDNMGSFETALIKSVLTFLER